MNILDIIINSLSTGGTYAMIALGYTMVYGIAKMLNFAHGDIIMVGAYTMLVCINRIPYTTKLGNMVADMLVKQCGLEEKVAANITVIAFGIISLIIAVIVCMLLGMIVEKLAYKPLRGASPLAVLITAIGVSYLLQSAAQIIFGPNQQNVPVGDFGKSKLFGVEISNYLIITLVVSVVVMVGLTLFIKLTRTGRAMVAVSEDKGAAQLMGINVNAIITLTFAIGSALAALAAYFTLIKNVGITNNMGAMPGIKAFTAAVIGGIGSVPGAMVGGILLGVIETVATKIPVIAPYKDAISFLVLVIILLVKPSGLLGKKRREKV
ncbi:MAG: branched-chain amino acid ABC transporter permease [Clostridia bacterium]|nr:branched-chain amino acid ABC transporter permease [Clostridia bacterium]